MGKSTLSVKNRILLSAVVFGFLVIAMAGYAVSAKVVGQIESVYLKRASMRILEVTPEASGTTALKVGQKISFMLPPEDKRAKSREKIEYGKVVEADLLGSPITEYDVSEALPNAKEVSSQGPGSSVFVWTASRVTRVKNPGQYLGEEPGNGKKRHGKKDRKNKDKNKTPDKIWTQEETVRGTVFLKNKRLYIKEESLRPRDLGLDVLSDDWYEKLKPFSGRVVVLHGTTNRVSPSSGTIDISNLIKVYPK